jgi:hypothetical protein
MAIFQVIDTTDGGDTGYEGFVKDAANWSVAETALSAANTKILVGGGVGSAPVFTAATGTGAPVRASSPTIDAPNITGSFAIDTIAEKTPNAGVTIDGVKLKDGGALAITGGTNTFNITNGTASLDVAAGKTIDLNGDITASGTLTYAGGTNTFNLACGTANIDIATGKAVNVDDDVTFTKGLTVTTNAGTIAFSASGKTLTVADDATISGTPVSPVGLHTIWVPAVAMVSRTTSGAAVGSVETGTNKNMLNSLDFDASADENAQFCIQMPKSWNEGTLTAAMVWSHPATTNNFGVAWFIQAVAFANDDAGDTAFGTAVSSVDTGGTTNDIYISPATSAMTVAGSPGANEYVMFQIYRDVSDAGDTMAVDARLHGVQIFYTTDAGTDA